MIAVIADDFTGAAEIGGVGLLYGCKSAIVRKVKQIKGVDLLIVATEMRSLNSENAALVSERTTKELLELNPEFIYKKIDSVLRGNIVAELRAQMKVSSKTTAIVIPANPDLNRTIKNGIYYVKDKPLLESKFADDFSFLPKSSNVLDIIGNSDDLPVTSISSDVKLLNKGLLIGNTINMSDLNEWASKVSDTILPTGAAGFFGAILKKRSLPKESYNATSFDENKKVLYICGSNFPMSKRAVLNARNNGHIVISMPDNIYNNRSHDLKLIDHWSEEIIQKFKSNKRIILSVLQKPSVNSIKGEQIKNIFGVLVKKIVDEIDIDELVIEGGSTAYNITEKLGINVFYPLESLAPGVTRMKVDNTKKLFLTVKPGSYVWPKSIWKFGKK